MGPLIEETKLPEFIKGLIHKSTMSKRPNYLGVIDFKRLLSDYIDNTINERSFVCVDRKFF